MRIPSEAPHRDDPSLQVGKDGGAKLLAVIGFKPADRADFILYRN